MKDSVLTPSGIQVPREWAQDSRKQVHMPKQLFRRQHAKDTFFNMRPPRALVGPSPGYEENSCQAQGRWLLSVS